MKTNPPRSDTFHLKAPPLAQEPAMSSREDTRAPRGTAAIHHQRRQHILFRCIRLRLRQSSPRATLSPSSALHKNY